MKISEAQTDACDSNMGPTAGSSSPRVFAIPRVAIAFNTISFISIMIIVLTVAIFIILCLELILSFVVKSSSSLSSSSSLHLNRFKSSPFLGLHYVEEKLNVICN